MATRGDGRTGEDVTAQAQNISGLPKTLAETIDCEVRGEVFMTEDDFETASANRVASGKNAFVNPRNATAGSLRNVDAQYVAPMSFAAYDASGGPFDGIDSYSERLAKATTFGFTTAADLLPGFDKPVTGSAAVIARIDEIGERRANLGFPIDGAVVKVDDIPTRDRIGAISRTPKWAVAYKYAPDTATTRLNEIEVAVGRTGRISLTALLEPVFVGGTTISRATLHNPKWVLDADIRPGDVVYVYRAGDVIPRVNAPVLSQRPEGLPVWVPPTVCPQCGEPWNKTSLLWRCDTYECSISGRVAYALSRDVLDVDGGGEVFAEAVVEAGLVSDISDIYNLTIQQVAALVTSDGREIGVKNATKIVNGIQAAKNQPLNRQITSLGIRLTGRTMGRRLASHFGTLDAFRNASENDLAQVEGVGTEKAKVIREGLTKMAPIIDRLVSAGINTGTPKTEAPAGAALPLAGKTVVVSGSGPGLSRTEANEAVERLGGRSSGSVSKNTSLLVAGEGAGSKASKAEALGVEVMNAEDFAALVAANS